VVSINQRFILSRVPEWGLTSDSKLRPGTGEQLRNTDCNTHGHLDAVRPGPTYTQDSGPCSASGRTCWAYKSPSDPRSVLWEEGCPRTRPLPAPPLSPGLGCSPSCGPPPGQPSGRPHQHVHSSTCTAAPAGLGHPAAAFRRISHSLAMPDHVTDLVPNVCNGVCT